MPPILDATPMIFFLGLFATAAGVLFLVAGREDRRRAREIRDTPTRRIADANGDGRVEVRGKVIPAEGGTLAAPFTLRRVVWLRVRVEERGNNDRWTTVIDEVSGVRFLVDDGSGPPALVDAESAWMVLDRDTVSTSGTFEDPTPDALAFLAMHGKDPTFLGFNRSLRFTEMVLLPGDPVFALGPSRRDPDGRLVLFSETHHDLIVTNQSETELVSKLERTFWLSIVALAVGVPLLLLGCWLP